MSTLKIGWAGLGNMGTPMVKNLLKAGFEVTVYNRTRDKEKEALQAGAKSAGGLQALAQANDAVLVMVADDAAAREIFSGREGLLSADCRGKLLINVSTVSSQTSKELSELCSRQGAQFLEAPVSGSVKPAQEGTLIMLAGGDEEALAKAKPVFDALSKLTVHTGPVGTGSAAKLAINYLVGLNMQGLAETILFASKGGVSTENMLTIINEGSVGNATTKAKTPAIQKGEYPPAFALKLLVKDLRLAREQGLDAPLSAPLFDTYKAAMDNGLGDEDVMAVMKELQKGSA